MLGAEGANALVLPTMAVRLNSFTGLTQWVRRTWMFFVQKDCKLFTLIFTQSRYGLLK